MFDYYLDCVGLLFCLYIIIKYLRCIILIWGNGTDKRNWLWQAY